MKIADTTAVTIPDEDQRVVLGAASWQDFETILAIRGDRAGPRLYYLDGAIEIVNTSKAHEARKATIARLLATWALDSSIELNGFGSWTLKDEMREVGAEPDECYIVGDADKDIPDLAIEVESPCSTGLAKPEIYRRLGVRELWILMSDNTLVIRVLENDQWIQQATSSLLPALDPAWLVSFLEIMPQSAAVFALRE